MVLMGFGVTIVGGMNNFSHKEVTVGEEGGGGAMEELTRGVVVPRCKREGAPA